MKRRTFLKKTALTAAAVSLSPFSFSCNSRNLDYLFLNCTIFDGSGNEAFISDVAVKGERIVGIGKFPVSDARTVINLNKRILSPGFIDIHSHTSLKLLVNPRAESKITQGVTTEYYGLDGESVAPLTPQMREAINRNLPKSYDLQIDWLDFPEFFNALHSKGHAVNFGSFVGQGTLREYVIGQSDRIATNDDILKMQNLLAKAIENGIWGMSSGLEYTPGSFASTKEIAKVASVLKGNCFPYTTHMRNEDDFLLAAVDEAISISEGAGIPLHISHLKVQGMRNWNKIDNLLAKLNDKIFNGAPITFDCYPYLAYSTDLANLFPLWVREGGTRSFLSRLHDAETLNKIKEYTTNKIAMLGSWEAVLISDVHSKKNNFITGKRMPEIASLFKMDPFDTAVKLIIEEENHVGMVGFGMSEENTARLITHPKCVIASDGSALANQGPLSEGNPHPRSYGTFPRAIAHYVRDKKIIPLAQIIRKMTALPAEILGIPERGRITKNYYADLVIFDEERIRDRATFDQPHQYSTGIDYVFVNGAPVIHEGKITGELPGVVLKS